MADIPKRTPAMPPATAAVVSVSSPREIARLTTRSKVGSSAAKRADRRGGVRTDESERRVHLDEVQMRQLFGASELVRNAESVADEQAVEPAENLVVTRLQRSTT